MLVQSQYLGRSAIVNGLKEGRVLLAANRLREPAYFRGDLAQPVLFREALAALYQVVVSDYKYRPRDRAAFKAWLQEQDRQFLLQLGVRNKKIKARMDALEARLDALKKAQADRRRPFEQARAAYWKYLYEKHYEREFVLDPIITVYPDEIAFEAFSHDESTYARLAVKFELFEFVDEFGCGTTNIDFSPKLFREIQRIRSYRRTHFDIAATGLTVSTAGQATTEKKVELPESWVKGFLQVHSTMTLGLTRFHMAPVDLFNILRFLRRHRARKSPRALRYELAPGQPVRVILEPWEHRVELTPMPALDGGQPLTLELTPGALYPGDKPRSVRTWGRDRLHTIARLLPWTRRIDVYLAGFGLPSFYVLDLGPITFTLALSGWTDNDWTGGANFTLLSRRLEVAMDELTQTHEALRTAHYATEGALSSSTGLGVEKVRGALSYLCQSGRAMYDLAGGLYRHRELFDKPFSVTEAAAAISLAGGAVSAEEKAARDIVARGDVKWTTRKQVSTGYQLVGSVRSHDNSRSQPELHVDHEGRLLEARCTCRFYQEHKLTRGPCEHILALRLDHMRIVEQEDR